MPLLRPADGIDHGLWRRLQQAERLGLEVEEIGTLRRAHIEAVVGRGEAGDVLVDTIGNDAERLESNTIVAAEAVVGAHPDEAIAILHDVAHRVGEQSVLHGDVSEVHIVGHGTAGRRWMEDAEQQDDCCAQGRSCREGMAMVSDHEGSRDGVTS